MDEKEIKQYEKILEDKWVEGKPYVFVSYASRDKEYVYPTVVELRKRGFNIYIDAEFKEVATRSWLDQAKEKLMSADCRGVITFLSINYMRSYACFIEQLINLSKEMEEDRGTALPVIYISVDKMMGSKQEVSAYITNELIRKESQTLSVTMETEECQILKDTFLDCKFPDYDTPEKVAIEIGKIKNKHNVATKMNKFVLEQRNINFQPFKSVQECADLLEKNFTNNKNKDIELEKLEELIDSSEMYEKIKNVQTKTIVDNMDIVLDNDSAYSDMKIGQLAQNVLRPMLEKGMASDLEVQKMQETDYCKETFGLQYPLLLRTDEIKKEIRYYSQPLYINGERYRMCSEWFETPANNDRPFLEKWIKEHQTGN